MVRKREDAIKYKLELWKPPIRLVTREEVIPAAIIPEEITNEEKKDLSLTDLVKSMKYTPEKIGRKKLSQQEREERRKKFEVILQSEKEGK